MRKQTGQQVITIYIFAQYRKKSRQSGNEI